MTSTAPLRRLRTAAGVTVPGHSVAVVRMCFGAVVAISATRILARGWVEQLWVDPPMLLGWPGVSVPALPAPALRTVVVGIGLCGLAIAAGVATRASAGAFLLGFGYLELLDRTTYLNHYWAITLLAVLLMALPADGTWSLAATRSRPAGSPTLALTRSPPAGSPTLALTRSPPAGSLTLALTRRPRRGAARGIPAWALWLLRGQVAIVYVFAAVAKIDPDWLLRGEPLTTWLAARTDLPLAGPLLGLPGVGLIASWAGLLFDLTIVGWLWWRPTRLVAMIAVVAFHAGTWLLFPPIGVFPLLMVGLATLWLPPAWPVAALRRIGVAAQLPPSLQEIRAVPWTVLAAAAVWMLVQIALPLRHLAIPGDVQWTEEAGRFSWRVMAEEKVGWARFELTDPSTGTSDTVNISDVLTPNQAHVAAIRPDLLHQLAHLLADQRETSTGTRPVVHVDAWVTWNGRPHARLIDPTVDLAAQPWLHGRHQPWILPPPA